MPARAVREDRAAAGQPGRSAPAAPGPRRDSRHRDAVDEVQIVVRLGAVLLHQADEGDAVLVVVAPAQLVGGGAGDAQVRREELVDPRVHRAEQAVLGRVEGVVEVEEPLRVRCAPASDTRARPPPQAPTGKPRRGERFRRLQML